MGIIDRQQHVTRYFNRFVTVCEIQHIAALFLRLLKRMFLNSLQYFDIELPSLGKVCVRGMADIPGRTSGTGVSCGKSKDASVNKSELECVLVVEDDAELRDKILLPGLRRFGFEPVGVGSAIELYKWLVNNSCALILLDVGLPDDDGFAIAKHLRESTGAGIIILTGRQSQSDHIRALAEGADVYLTKPVDVELLASALHSLSRRMSTRSQLPPALNPAERWRIEANGWRLVAPNGNVIALSLPERAVLKKLESSDKPVPREDLIAELDEIIEDFDPSRLDMLIHRLRRKVETKAGHELPLSAVRKMGYMLSF
jgi:DNA-binding response OmpR family regulator